jgi:hypothetical protein
MDQVQRTAFIKEAAKNVCKIEKMLSINSVCVCVCVCERERERERARARVCVCERVSVRA